MVSDKTKNLWGKNFRIVPQGLAEADVATFVEQLMAEHHTAKEKLQHLDSLKELANRTIHEAQRVAADIREQAGKEAEDRAAAMIAEARERAQQILSEAQERGAKLARAGSEESHKQSSESLSEVKRKAEALLAEARESADGIVTEAVERAQKTLREANELSKRAQKALADAQQEARELLEAAKKEAKSPALTETRPYPSPTPRPIEPQLPAAKSAPTPGPALPQQPAPRPAPAVATRPPVRKAQPVIRWKLVPGATRYAIYITRPPHSRDDIVYKKEDIAGVTTSATIPLEMEEGVTYQWTIRAGNEKGWGPLAPCQKLSA
ncbi:MAG: hypothetical protein FJ312_08325 [SAR202 cluster bacterium]|nr:hypothetical protein [SAR202 cluster bacterium]